MHLKDMNSSLLASRPCPGHLLRDTDADMKKKAIDMSPRDRTVLSSVGIASVSVHRTNDTGDVATVRGYSIDNHP